MKKKVIATLAVLTTISAAACSFENHTNVQVDAGTNTPTTITVETGNGEKETTLNINSDNPKIVSVETNEVDEDNKDSAEEDKNTQESGGEEASAVTDEDALKAIQNLCFEENPNLKDTIEEGDYPVYWTVESSDDTQIVVLYRAYTGAQIRYYIDRESGDTQVTEFVPGITDAEEKTEQTFNIKDYLK